MNEHIPLSSLLIQNKDAEPPVEPVVPFAALYLEEPRICTAVLERTCVLASASDKYDRVTATHDKVYVDRERVEWRTKTADDEGRRLSGSKSAVGRRFRHYPHQDGPKEDELRFLRQRSAEQAAEKEKEEVAEQTQPFEVVASGYSGSPMRVPADAQGTKRCRRCGDDKPRGEFAATGIYGGYCATCEPLEKADRAAARQGSPKPAKASKRKYTRREQQAAPKAPIPAEFGASVRHKPLSFKELIERIVGERDALKARVDELEAERAQAFAQLQEVLG